MPRIGLSGATDQSEPNASFAPASSSERNAYDDAQRFAPMRPSAQRPSSMAWYGCIDAMTPSSLKRGIILRPQVLGMLDAEAAVARAVRLRHLGEDVEQLGVGLDRRWRGPRPTARLGRRR